MPRVNKQAPSGSSLTFLKYKDVYGNDFLSVLVGMLSSTRWFTEWMIVSEFRALPSQYGYTDVSLDYFFYAGYALDDISIAREQDNNGWYFNALPMLIIGLGSRMISFSIIHIKNRRKMNRTPILQMLLRGGLRDKLWVFFVGVLPLLTGLAGSVWVILRKRW